MNKIDSLIAPQTKDFVRLCRKYFEYLETLPDKNISDFWHVQLNMLPKIYTGLFQLPKLKGCYSSDVEKYVTEREYNKTLTNLATYIGTLDKFTDFADLSHPGSVKVIETNLSEILTDIYQELKDFVFLYESGTIENMNDAIVECLDSFERYWGIRMLSATRIIHVNLYQHRYSDAKKSLNLSENTDNYDEEDDDEDTDIDENLLNEIVEFDDGMD